MGNLPSFEQNEPLLPMTHISWNDCQKFISMLNSKTNGAYRLLLESEWEYAARGAVFSKGHLYSGSGNIDEVAWYAGNSGHRLHPVNEKKPNEIGIYDISGNVWEWCLNYFDETKWSHPLRGAAWATMPIIV